MKLTDLGFETSEVLVRKARPAKGETPATEAKFVTVRGLGSEDIMRLVRLHGTVLAATFDGVISGKKEINLDSTAEIVGLVADQAPSIIGDIIQLAADAEDSHDGYTMASRLPFPTQLRIIEEVANLTFVDTTPGEFLEMVLKMTNGANDLYENLLRSSAGSLASAKA